MLAREKYVGTTYLRKAWYHLKNVTVFTCAFSSSEEENICISQRIPTWPVIQTMRCHFKIINKM